MRAALQAVVPDANTPKAVYRYRFFRGGEPGAAEAELETENEDEKSGSNSGSESGKKAKKARKVKNRRLQRLSRSGRGALACVVFAGACSDAREALRAVVANSQDSTTEAMIEQLRQLDAPLEWKLVLSKTLVSLLCCVVNVPYLTCASRRLV